MPNVMDKFRKNKEQKLTNNSVELKSDKGELDGSCNRTACQQPHAIFLNKSTQKYYCIDCAMMLNRANHDDSIRLYGTPLLCEIDVKYVYLTHKELYEQVLLT